MVSVIVGVENGIRILGKLGYIRFAQFFGIAIGQIGSKVDKYFGIIAFDFGDASSYLVRTSMNGYFHKFYLLKV